MLELTAGCFEAGTRHLARTAPARRHTQRQLHSTFWHHGARDLGLPGWWTSNPSHGAGVGAGLAKKKAIPSSRGSQPRLEAKAQPWQGSVQEMGFLDFLYPAQALKLFSLPSAEGCEALERRGRMPGAVRSHRGFTSSSWYLQEIERSLEEEEQEEDVEENEEVAAEEEEEFKEEKVDSMEAEQNLLDMLPTQSKLERLEMLLKESKSQEATRAYHCFMSVEADQVPQTLVSDLLKLLGRDVKRHSKRIVTVFDKLQPVYRDSSSYVTAVQACIMLGRSGSAVSAYREACHSFQTTRLPSQQLIGHLLSHQMFQLAYVVYDCHRRYIDSGEWDAEQAHLFSIPYTAEFPIAVHGFCEHYIKGLSSDLESNPQRPLNTNLGLFISHVVTRAITLSTEHVRDDENFWSYGQGNEGKRKGDEEKGIGQGAYRLKELFLCLRKHRLSSIQTYEDHFLAAVFSSREYSLDRHRDLVDLIVTEMMNDRVEPSKQGLRTLLKHYSRHSLKFGSFERLRQVEKMWYAQFGNQSVELIVTLMPIYAHGGHINDVQRLFGRYRHLAAKKVQDDEMTSTPQAETFPFSWLIHTHARRADVKAAKQAFDDMKGRNGVTPDVTCYNELLLAYSRTDDPVGGISLFQEMLAYDIKPTAATMELLLGIYAWRGDLESVEGLLGAAHDFQVSHTIPMSGSLMETYRRLGELEACEKVLNDVMSQHGDHKDPTTREQLRDLHNILLHGLCEHSDLDRFFHVLNGMQRANLQKDDQTYAYVLHILFRNRRQGIARDVFNRLMERDGVQHQAVHYSVAMAGLNYNNDPRGVHFLWKQMHNNDIQPTISIKAQYLRAKLFLQRKVRLEAGRHLHDMAGHQIRQSIIDLLEELDAVAAAGETLASASIVDPTDQPVEELFAMLLWDLSYLEAFPAIRTVLAQYEKRNGRAYDTTRSIGMLASLAGISLKGGDYALVERYFYYAREQAVKTVSATGALRSGSAIAETHTIRARRHILNRVLKPYIESLIEQGAIDKLRAVVSDVIQQGWRLDTACWNLVVQGHAKYSRFHEAFQICEGQLMPHWPGWRLRKLGGPIGPMAYIGGFQNFNFDRLKRDVDLPKPQYPTLVILAGAALRVTVMGQSGLMQQLRRAAPRTFKALDSMPMINDEHQLKYLQL